LQRIAYFSPALPSFKKAPEPTLTTGLVNYPLKPGYTPSYRRITLKYIYICPSKNKSQEFRRSMSSGDFDSFEIGITVLQKSNS
jgi:hypothetical protein